MYFPLKEYIKNIDGVSHVTFDPYGPGVVRIYLIPPKKIKPGISWTVLLNGQDLLPISLGWAILLREFINSVNMHSGEVLDDDMISNIINDAANATKKVFRSTDLSTLKKDLKQIVNVLVSVARHEDVKENIGYLTLEKYAKYMSAPHRMDLMISSMSKEGIWHCNQKCLFCYAGMQHEANTKELTTEEWKRIIDKCKEANIPQLTFTGGEPTMREDLVELVDYAKWFVTRLNTNGQLLTKSLCDSLYDASLDSVQVTLYSNLESVHNILVGANGFNKTIDGIKNAISANLNISINTPLCKLNANYVDLVKYAHEELGVNYFTCSSLILTGNAKEENDQVNTLTSEELLQILKEANQYATNNNVDISFTSPGWIDDFELKKLKMTIPACGACSSNMAISPSGEVVPCQSWLSDGSLGNMLNDSWYRIFNSRRCRKLRKMNVKANNKCPLNAKEKKDEKN